MAATGVPMELRYEIWRRHADGQAIAQISRELDISRATVRKYAEQVQGTDLDGEPLIKVAMTYEDAAQLTGDVEAKSIAHQLRYEQGQRSAVSLKARVLTAVTAAGEFASSVDLYEQLRRDADAKLAQNWSHHEVVSALHQLRKQGRVQFRVDKRPSGGRSVGTLGGGDPVHIRLTREPELEAPEPEAHGVRPGGTNQMPRKAGRPPELNNRVTGSHPAGWSRRRHAVGRDYTEPGRHGAVASGGEILRTSAPETVSVPAEVAPEPQAQPASFPLLTELRQRLAGRQASDAQSAKLMEAAAILEDIDPVESARLMAKAEELGGTPFSAIEAEYLRFAGDC